MELTERINKLKKEKNAVILAHNYQMPEVQDIADFVGDSLELSIQASKTAADVIVFCGVHFMAETAKILSPQKRVLLPDKKAGCPMADMINADQLWELKAVNPGAKAMCYVNTSAEVKAQCDLCCTSSNAVKITKEAFLPQEEIIFIPDKYLAHYVSEQTGRDFITWHGFCPTHANILPEIVLEQKRLHPEAMVMAHPECRPEVIALADRTLSTSGMLKYAREDKAKEFIVCTETGILHRLKKESPGKTFYPIEVAVCPNMKRTTLEKILWSLEEMYFEIDVSPEVIALAGNSIRRMLEY
jgi:quinolinate synthase